MKRRAKLTASLLALPFAAVALYFLVAWLMALFPANTERHDGSATIDAFIISNGAHVDLVFPVKSPAVDWTTIFPLRDFPAPPANPAYIAIGWGDREFYLNTETLGDITLSRALGALAGGHGTLVHVDYLPDLNFGTQLYRLPLSPAQYASLIAYVRQSLLVSPAGEGVAIAGRHYGPRDAFYEARGSYSLFNTCNTWVGTGLAQAGVKTSRWTPLASLVVWHLQEAPGS